MRVFLLVLAAGVLAATGPARADEEDIPLDKLPKAVADGFKKRFPEAKPTGASKETTEDKKVVYEVTFQENGKNRDITFTDAGVLTTIEKQIDPKDLPKAVKDALEAKYPKATYKIAEEVIAVKDGKETLDYYEALLEAADKKGVEVEIAADGTIKKTEDKTEELKKEREKEKKDKR
ncbi:MAG TPA: PepSY-like domain-containing protein [Gemmataceae bacterium]|jgi:hypothetical protein|nr:PepSY-like domain-containing protein [Gemmataceae bacterium]